MALHKGDKVAGITGFIVGAVLLLGLVLGVVAWTNSRFEGHGAAQQGHGPPQQGQAPGQPGAPGSPPPAAPTKH
jgi:hypothetical protein